MKTSGEEDRLRMSFFNRPFSRRRFSNRTQLPPRFLSISFVLRLGFKASSLQSRTVGIVGLDPMSNVRVERSGSSSNCDSNLLFHARLKFHALRRIEKSAGLITIHREGTDNYIYTRFVHSIYSIRLNAGARRDC